MRRKLKYTGFSIGLIMLFLIITLKFIEDDSWNAWNLPLTGKIIVLDAGHGGMDGGANFESIQEKEISLAVTKKIQDFLQEQGALVLLTREDDSDLASDGTKGIRNRKREDLQNRVKVINESEADLFLSIHLNAFPSRSSSGAQTFYTNRYLENKQAAEFIQQEIIRNLENTSRQPRVIQNIYLMANATKPGALVEIGFISNAAERQNLIQESYQEKIAAAVYKGILRYFTEDPIEEEDKE
ncbi:N-acetylmuramoyl-L-alanine amidase CwlD [Peribacillus psychrosaccharolyticus]|uniref:N-acetylmuramoyl-L-alanine amidase CwlD n=1 Tax=Peribacillus psychrosaccharolyticus TaxID=1407 RepID=A0A974NJ38_PERPY|nr:N-acetylmuramoyl-L-alanine amidase CwlD [Peribacillus psychrosaccharolyticus]MEC2057991.1 N-acetylmuramoyl-L-alanine amidase CwlD [Peribacillus psychrosaccharolyticus]MED3745867.1 N-acetylmuramoyl-L-alanine amidase CwlD [Peribacillus psychrosaccharolyticus]QQS98728.1 N-acetylmuramoyl-L-alanine amidase CwlD [Peribacillus psychrosaccharolyticus]